MSSLSREPGKCRLRLQAHVQYCNWLLPPQLVVGLLLLPQDCMRHDYVLRGCDEPAYRR